MGHGKEDVKSIRILNRIVTLKDDGVEYEADQRHAEIIVKQMGLSFSDKSVSTPIIKMCKADLDTGNEELDSGKGSMYRAMVARANYLAQDRSDIRFAVKELSRHMSKPREKDLNRLKRLARYLIGCPRMISKIEYQSEPKTIEGWCDSNWVGCLETRKSTSGGLMKIGKHVIKTWSTTQGIIALSSGEAEYYAIVKAGSQALGLRAMAKDFGIDLKIKIITDATAAQGISLRRGLGQVRHIETNTLWIQDRVRRGDIEIEKIGGKDNISDAMTKEAGSESLGVHMRGCNLFIVSGRHELAPEVDKENLISV